MTPALPPPPARRWPGRLIWAVAAMAPPLVMYARTMAPGLLALGDVPKLQYLGVVLGTAHAPGYPLFIALSWAAVHLPLGGVGAAWRINAMTALFGVAAAGAAAWAARRCGASRSSALLAAWGLSFGPVFWDQATAAEVYTLAALFQALAIALVLRWAATRRDGHLLQAVAVSALALGHHPTFAMMAPALALFVLVTDWRVLTRPRVVLGSAGLVLLGLAQYGYLMWRTAAGSLYLEARASSLAELVDVLRGRQFEQSFFAFTAGQWITERLPLVGSLVLAELTPPGLALAAAGLAWLAWRRWRTALLLAAMSAIIVVFAASYDVPDVQVFVIPVFVCAWISAAVGLEALTSRMPSPALSRLVPIAVAAGLAALAVRTSYASHDLSGETWDARYVRALVEQVPSPATVVVHYDDAVSHALRYVLFVDGLGRTHRIRISTPRALPAPAEAIESRPVYVFDPARGVLEGRGFLLAPVVLDASLADRLDDLHADTTVVVHLPAGAAAWLTADDVRFLQAMGLPRLPAGGSLIIARHGTLLATVEGPDAVAAAELANGTRVEARSLPSGVTIAVNGEVAADRLGGVAVGLDASGGIDWLDELDRAEGRRPVMDMARRPLYRAVGAARCETPDDSGWVRVAGGPDLATRLAASLEPPVAQTGRDGPVRIVAYAASDSAAPGASGGTLTGDPLAIDVRTFDRATDADRAALAAATGIDAVTLDPSGRFVARWAITLPESTAAWAGLGALVVATERPAWLAMHATGAGGTSVRFCLPPVQGVVPFGDPSASRAELVRGQSDAIGPGWHGPEGLGADRLRWTAAPTAIVRVSLLEPIDLRLELDAGPQVAEPGARIDVRINGVSIGARPLAEGQQHYEWAAPARYWRAGYNEIAIDGPTPRSPRSLGRGTDDRLLGLGVKALVLRRSAG